MELPVEYSNAIVICFIIYALAIAWFALFTDRNARSVLAIRFISSVANCFVGACLGSAIYNMPGRVLPNILIGIILGGVITYFYSYRKYLESVKAEKR